jgi:TRAP-type C4-dicarboxylate transport system permease small subunit
MSRLLLRIENAMIVVAVIATAIMMLLTSADALLRYSINQPIMGAYELTEKYLMVASIFLGFTYAYRGGAFIRVTFLVDMLPQPLKVAANWFAYLVSVGCCGLLLYATGNQAAQALSDQTTLATLPIRAGPSQIVVPIGFLGLFVLMLLDLRRVSSGEALLFSQESPTEQS